MTDIEPGNTSAFHAGGFFEKKAIGIASNAAVFLTPDRTLIEAVGELHRENLNLVVVVDRNNCPLGTMTTSDILRAIEEKQHADTPVSRLMNTEMLIMKDDAAILDIWDLYRYEQIGSLLIVDEFDSLQGIITDEDVRLHFSRQNEEQSRQIFYHNPSPMIIYDVETLQFLTVNRAFMMLYFCTEEEALSMSLGDIFPESSMTDILRESKFSGDPKNLTEIVQKIRLEGSEIEVPLHFQDIIYEGRPSRVMLIMNAADLLLARQQATRKDSLLESVFNVLPDLFLVLENKGVIRDFRAQNNDELFGRPEDFLGKHLAEIFPGSISELIQDKMRELTAAPGELLSFEYDMAVSGNIQHYECRMTTLPNSDLFIAVIRNITEQHLDKQVIRENEQRFRNLLEYAPFPIIIITNNDGVMRYGNLRAQKKFRFTQEEGVGLLAKDFFSYDGDRVRFLKQLNDYGNVDEMEIRMIDFTGTPFWALLSASIVEYEGEPAVMVAVNDIDDRKKMEITLEDERSRLDTLIQTIPDPIWVKNTEGIYIACNVAFEKLLDAPHEKIIGSVIQDFYPGPVGEKYDNDDKKVIETGSLVSVENPLYKGSGEFIGIYHELKAPICDANGNISGILGIARDVTESKNLQNELTKRIREQQCLYDVFAFSEDVNGNLDEQVKSIIEHIPAGMEYQDLCEVRIDISGRQYSSPKFRETPVMLSAMDTGKHGETVTLDIVYTEDPGRDPGDSFHPEEKVLANAIVHRLTDVINKRTDAAALFEREQLVSTMFAQSKEAIILMDIQSGEFLEFNAVAHESLGYTRHEFSRMKAADFRMGSIQDEIIAGIEKRQLEGQNDIEVRISHRDGSERDVALTLKPITLGGRAMVSAVWRDITEQKAREAELEKYRLHLEELVSNRTNELKVINEEQHAIFNSATNGILLIIDQTIERCNIQAEKILGFGSGELAGKPTRIWYIDHRSYELGEKYIHNDLSSGRIHQSEQQFTRKDGTLFWARMSGQALDRTDLSRGYVIIMEDISLEKRAIQALEESKQAAEEANRSKSVFLANMSHEIRTPMNAIMGLSHLVLKTELNKRQQEYIGKIHSSSQHLLGIINDILDISKIEAGKMTLEKTDFDLENLLTTVTELLNEKAGKKGLELILNTAPDVPLNLIGDSLRLSQIILNYGSNAVKFTEKGEINIRIKVREKIEDDVILYFEVTDTGIGMTQEQLGQLFRSFEQADSSITRRFGGTGLGLAISKQLVSLMQGEVGVSSEHGVGSTFWFTARFGIGILQKDLLIPDLDLRKLPVLVVDDNDNARTVLCEILTAMTYNVTEVPSGEEALEAVREADRNGEPFRLVYIDWQMPGIDGLETSRQINEMELSIHPPIILVTAFGREEVLKESGNLPVDEILTKPFSPSTIFDASMQVLGSMSRSTHRLKERGSDLQAELHKIKGARLLLVEDNEINQDVAVGLLEDAGFVVDVAENGAVALDRLMDNSYDLVLMDMQMPVMDGITASIRIRQQKAFRDLPIIAMTANAMLQDKEACLNAGMNGYISKPIDPDILWSELLKWINPADFAGGKQEKPETEDDNEETELPDRIPGLDLKQGLGRVIGNTSRYIELLRKFAGNYRDIPKSIRESLADGDIKTAEREAHTVKGVAGNLGALDLQKKAADLEAAIRSGSGLSFIGDLIDIFENSLVSLLQELDRVLPDDTSEEEVPEQIDIEQAERVLADMKKMLSEDDGASLELFKEHIHSLRYSLRSGFNRFRDAVESFDFEEALKILNEDSPDQD